MTGPIRLRLTHPNLWRSVQIYAALTVALGFNFILLHPTFPIYGASYYLWGGIFLGLGTAKLVFSNVVHNLTAVRVAMAAEIAYMLFLGVGTMEPYLNGVGSLQLPILYLGLCALELPLLLEPFFNPWTARERG